MFALGTKAAAEATRATATVLVNCVVMDGLRSDKIKKESLQINGQNRFNARVSKRQSPMKNMMFAPEIRGEEVTFAIQRTRSYYIASRQSQAPNEGDSHWMRSMPPPPKATHILPWFSVLVKIYEFQL